jgi:hypothetical protein
MVDPLTVRKDEAQRRTPTGRGRAGHGSGHRHRLGSRLGRAGPGGHRRHQILEVEIGGSTGVLRRAGSGRRLDVPNPGQSDGTQLALGDCNDAADQKWTRN